MRAGAQLAVALNTFGLYLPAALLAAPLAHGADHGAAPKTPFGELTRDLSHTETGSMARGRAKLYLALLAHQQARQAGVPADLVDAVIRIESAYDPTRVGSAGEIGLMQVRPGTAALLGFTGTLAELARPDINVHYGTIYLAQAWHITGGDICRTLMKYRAGHSEERMSPLSELYCQRARAHLAEVGSSLAPVSRGLVTGTAPQPRATLVSVLSISSRHIRALHGQAFWVAEEARVKAATLRVHARWRLAAMRGP